MTHAPNEEGVMGEMVETDGEVTWQLAAAARNEPHCEASQSLVEKREPRLEER